MENQNSVPQEPSAGAEGRGSSPAKKKFFASLSKKKKVIIAVLVVLFFIGMTGRWFTFGAARGGYRGLSYAGSGNVALVVKDFEPIGIVFADAAGAAWDGYRTTYDALMKEAAQKGADAIINVNISSKGIFFNRTWSGSALAVKYLDSLPEGYPGISAAETSNTALLMRRGWFGRNRY